MVIAICAMLLAITGLGGNNATKEAVNSNIQASNLLELLPGEKHAPDGLRPGGERIRARVGERRSNCRRTRRAAIQRKMEDYRKTIARYESEPETDEGKKELIARARAEEKKRDHALKQDPYFDYAEALLQIAIVLISVAIVAEQIWLSYIGGVLGLIGGLLMINGFLLLVRGSVPG